MKLIEFPEQTVVIAKDQPEYLPLPAFQFANDPTGRIACCWQLTWRERFKLLFTGKLWHVVMAFHQPLQPQLLQLEKPFQELDVAEARMQKEREASAANFHAAMLAKYSAAAKRRKNDYDQRGYHPNDRRRTVKFEPADFAAAQKHGLLFLLGCRIVNEQHQSAV